MSAPRILPALCLLLTLTLAIACGDDDGGGGTDGGGGGTDSGMTTDGGGMTEDGGTSIDAGPPPAFELTSPAFTEGEMIPLRHECGSPFVPTGPGENITPKLSWTAGPAETMSYAIVMRDNDFGGLVHWVIYDIPGDALELEEAIPEGYEPAAPAPTGAKQGEIQMSGLYGYFGPCSPDSVNTYEWTLHALDTATLADVTMASPETEIASAIEAASIASTTLSGES